MSTSVDRALLFGSATVMALVGCGDAAPAPPAPPTCADLECEARNRSCIEADAGRRCGPCFAGYEPGFLGICDPIVAPEVARGACGRATLPAIPSAPIRIDFPAPIEAPIVVAPVLTRNDPDPAHPRIAEVSREGFTARIREWAAQDGVHDAEALSWVAVARGAGTWSDGARYEAGGVEVDGAARRVRFEPPLESPLVIAHVVTANGADPVVVRLAEIAAEGFELRLQEEEGGDGEIAAETVHFLAFEPAPGAEDGFPWTGGRLEDVTHQPTDLGDRFSTPPAAFVASLSSSNGGDTAAVRVRSAADGAPESLRVEEEQSRDEETNHTEETVDWLACTRSGAW